MYRVCIAHVSHEYRVAHVNMREYVLNTCEYVYRAQTPPKVSANTPLPGVGVWCLYVPPLSPHDREYAVAVGVWDV